MLNMLDFTALHWRGGDVCLANVYGDDYDGQQDEHFAYRVSVYGKSLPCANDNNMSNTPPGSTVCVHVWFNPFFFVEIGPRASTAQIRAFMEELRRALGKKLERELHSAGCMVARNFVGTQNPTGFLKLVFRSQRALRRADFWLRDKKPHVRRYETRADPLVGLLHERRIWSPCCFNRADPCVLSVDVERRDPDAIAEPETTCAKEVLVYPEAVSQGARPDEVVRHKEAVVASFDLECYSSTDHFPNPAVRENVIIAMCTTFSKQGSPCYRKVALALGPVETDSFQLHKTGIELECFARESQLLGRWARLLAEERVDVLTGYNIWGFDMRYVYQRVLVNGGVMNPDLVRFAEDLSRVRDAALELWKGKVKSGGGQVVEACTIQTDGVLQIDMMYYLKRFHPRLESYKLDHVARTLLKQDDGNDADQEQSGKTGLTIQEMQAIWRDGDAKKKWAIMLYCVQDATLVSRLMHTMAVLENVFEMANVCTVSATCVMMQGEQAKVYSLIQREAHAEGMLCPSSSTTNSKQRLGADDEKDDPDENGMISEANDRLQGATVLEPLRGAYWDPIACMDFQSLYPSIMMAHNLCHSTLVTTSSISEDDVITVPVSSSDVGHTLRFLKPSKKRGILPKLLAELQTKRREAKAAAADAGLPAETRTMMNAKQQAYKVSMNSIYGFCGVGSNAGMLPCLEVASAVTSIGRSMILRTRDFVHETYPGSVVVYGDTDSLMVNFFTGGPGPSPPLSSEQKVERCLDLGTEAASRATLMFERPIKLSFEKCYMPYLLFCKKRYIGREPGEDGRGGVLDCKGLQFVRRDTCSFVKRLANAVLEKLLFDMDVDAATAMVRNSVADLLAVSKDIEARRREHIDDFVITKSIRYSAADILRDVEKSCGKCASPPGTCVNHDGGSALRCLSCGYVRKVAYKNTATPAIQVACSLERAHPGHGPKSGDSVSFVYVDPSSGTHNSNRDAGVSSGKRRRVLCSEMAEDPEVAYSRGMALDARFYLDHQLKNVMVELFSLVSRTGSEKETERSLFGDLINAHEAAKINQSLISSFCSAAPPP